MGRKRGDVPAQRNSLQQSRATQKNGFIPDMNTEAADQKGGSVFADFGIMCACITMWQNVRKSGVL